MTQSWKRRLTLAATTGLLVMPFTSAAVAATATDVQANNPQVAGDPSSDTTAVFPTNKQNEPTIAVNPVDSRFLIAGSNDEQRQPPCGPGPVRGGNAADSDCSFFPGVATSGVYTSSDGGSTWTNRGLLDDQPSWRASDLISDGDPVISFGPKPGKDGKFSYANGVRAYYRPWPLTSPAEARTRRTRHLSSSSSPTPTIMALPGVRPYARRSRTIRTTSTTKSGSPSTIWRPARPSAGST
jgi:hypothetical protein